MVLKIMKTREGKYKEQYETRDGEAIWWDVSFGMAANSRQCPITTAQLRSHHLTQLHVQNQKGMGR